MNETFRSDDACLAIIAIIVAGRAAVVDRYSRFMAINGHDRKFWGLATSEKCFFDVKCQNINKMENERKSGPGGEQQQEEKSTSWPRESDIQSRAGKYF